jgi:hypothetical protein
MIAKLDSEIERLTESEKKLLAIETQSLECKLSAAAIPWQDVSDRLLRLDTHYDRQIDRSMNRLERLQRMRKGQPLPPQINLNIA